MHRQLHFVISFRSDHNQCMISWLPIEKDEEDDDVDDNEDRKDDPAIPAEDDDCRSDHNAWLPDCQSRQTNYSLSATMQCLPSSLSGIWIICTLHLMPIHSKKDRYQNSFPKPEVFSNEVLYTIAFNFERRFHYTNTYTSLHKYIYIIPQIHKHHYTNTYTWLHKYIYISKIDWVLAPLRWQTWNLSQVALI